MGIRKEKKRKGWERWEVEDRKIKRKEMNGWVKLDPLDSITLVAGGVGEGQFTECTDPLVSSG